MISPVELKPTSKVHLIKTIRIPSGGRKQIVLRLTDENGRPVDLTHEPVNCPASVAKFGVEPRAGEGNLVLRLVAVSQFGETYPQIDVVGKLINEDGSACLAGVNADPATVAKQCSGLVEFLLDHVHTCIPGIYRCEIQRIVAPDFLLETWPVYFAIEPSLFNASYRLNHHGPITIPEVRMSISDLAKTEVDLLDSLEFEDAQILFAMRQPIDMWNEMPPSGVYFSTENFPYRYNWLRATGAQLLTMAAHGYRRNQLNYSAGGIEIDDQNKFNQYQQIADAIMGEYRDWMRREKLRLNTRRTWRSGV